MNIEMDHSLSARLTDLSAKPEALAAHAPFAI
jgi:hypothetical protein